MRHSENKPFLRAVFDWHEYSGESLDEIIKKIRRGKELASTSWKNIVKSGSDEEIMRFYAESNDYMYAILAPYLEPHKYGKNINYNKIVSFCKRLLLRYGSIKVLDFGGGVGELCLMLWEAGADVTYADIRGIISDFARWRFNKYGADIKVIYSSINTIKLPLREYDLITSDAVIEHFKREYLENFIIALSSGLKPKRFLYLLWDPTYTKDFPMHILGLKQIDHFMRKYGLFRISRNLYIKSSAPKYRICSYLFSLKYFNFLMRITKSNLLWDLLIENIIS